MDSRLVDQVQWAVEESIERNPLTWPQLVGPYRCAMSKENVGPIRGRLVFWYTFDREHIHFWRVELIGGNETQRR